jgi:hypothetical protein
MSIVRKRDFKKENKRAFVRKLYKDLLNDESFKVLQRDLDRLLWEQALRNDETEIREVVVNRFRILADNLETLGKDHQSDMLLGPEDLHVSGNRESIVKRLRVLADNLEASGKNSTEASVFLEVRKGNF